MNLLENNECLWKHLEIKMDLGFQGLSENFLLSVRCCLTSLERHNCLHSTLEAALGLNFDWDIVAQGRGK